MNCPLTLKLGLTTTKRNNNLKLKTMWTLIIITGIILGILLILLCVGLKENWDKDYIFILLCFYSIFSVFFYGSIFTTATYKSAQIQALKGKFDYKMEIRYELKDSIYIPIDTVFTKIN